MIEAIYVHNNGWDAIVLQDGSWLQVESEDFQAYIAEDAEKWLYNWHGNYQWEASDVWESAKSMGAIIAFYEDGNLVIREPAVWERRVEYWMGREIVGVAEAAKILGWDKRKLSTYLQRGVFPAPLQRLASGPIWTRAMIEEFAKTKTAPTRDE